jgi:hypothetical protein
VADVALAVAALTGSACAVPFGEVLSSEAELEALLGKEQARAAQYSAVIAFLHRSFIARI